MRDVIYANLYDSLTPTTLAAIVHDLTGTTLTTAKQLARQALVANCGEEEARELIDAQATDNRQTTPHH